MSEVRGGEVDSDDRLIANGAPLIELLDDDYGGRWESTGIAARWNAHIGWHGSW